MKEIIKKTFVLKLNGQIVCDFEASGSPEIVESFVKQTFTDTFGIFYKWKDNLGKMYLNEIEVTMQTIFKDKKGRFAKPDIKI